VVPSALSFSFELVAQGTSVEAAELILEEGPRCRPVPQVRRREPPGGLPAAVRGVREA
jgi:hypothetical protein